MRMLVAGLLLGVLLTLSAGLAVAYQEPSAITAFLARRWKPNPKTIEGTTGEEFLEWGQEGKKTYVIGAIAGVTAATDYMKSVYPGARAIADDISRFGKTDRYYAEELTRHLRQFPNDKNLPVLAVLYWVRDHEDRR
ncbi:MAG: hypothetical protein HY660_15250 [Armatimonadetes bacterium]|nr:hypothetical protein [Armatimonadota bacterium]